MLQGRRQHDEMIIMLVWCNRVYQTLVTPANLLRRTLFIYILVNVCLADYDCRRRGNYEILK